MLETHNPTDRLRRDPNLDFETRGEVAAAPTHTSGDRLDGGLPSRGDNASPRLGHLGRWLPIASVTTRRDQ